ncbi:MAG: toprim domain-containing protein [Candidatus Paceibacteria bacterium]
MPKTIAKLADLFSEIPGIGPRQARRIVQFLLRADARYKKELSTLIASVSSQVSQCAQCQRYDEVNTGNLCPLCADTHRDSTVLMVVEKDVDVESIEEAGVFKGRYFVLGSLIPLARQRKSAVSARTELLEGYLMGQKSITEIVFAFATTPEGDYTAGELTSRIKTRFPKLKVSQLGRGLSLGAEIEYADQETLRNAFQGRH